MTVLNTILITVDSLRYDCFREDLTPNLVSLSDNSYIFDKAYTTGPWTPEAVPGIVAGYHSHNSFYYGDVEWKALPEDATTLATYFHDIGYDTTAVLTNPHLTENRNFDLGFQEFKNLEGRTKETDDTESASIIDYLPFDKNELVEKIRYRARKAKSIYSLFILPHLINRYYYQYSGEWPSVDGEVVIQEFENQLDECSTPVFGWTHLMDPHSPIPPELAIDTDHYSIHQLLRWDAAATCNIGSQNYSQLYNGAVKHVDTQIGRLIDYLKDRGIWNETILIVTADHGEALYERGVSGHPAHYMMMSCFTSRYSYVPRIVPAGKLKLLSRWHGFTKL